MRALRPCAIAFILLAGAMACLADTPAEASSKSKSWVIGICRFTDNSDPSPASIRDTFPLLILSHLKNLPQRITPKEEAREAAELTELRNRFALGADLAKKLDTRASDFFTYTTDDLVYQNALKQANDDITQAQKKLDQELHPKKDEAKPLDTPPTKLTASLWPDHASAKLIEAPQGSLADAAKSAAVNLLVFGRIYYDSGYATIILSAYDADLTRVVFSWKGFCAVDDPSPLAEDFAGRLEAWTAGRPMAKIAILSDPPSAEISVNGQLLKGSSHVYYSYSDAPIEIVAEAGGFKGSSIIVHPVFGQTMEQKIKLEPIAGGKLSLATDPQDATVNVNSMPLGKAPTVIELNGERSFLDLSAEGYESETLVLPAKGDEDLNVKLRLSDGLGPKGRIESARDRFYVAFGIFAVTLPITVISAGVYNQYTYAYTLSSGASNIASEGAISAYVLDGSIALTALSAAYSIYQLIQFLGSTN